MSCCSPHSITTATVTTAVDTPIPPLTDPKVHLHLHAPDLHQAVSFFSAFFAAPPVKLKSGYAKFLPSWAPVNLAISEHAAARKTGPISHVGIQLPSPEAVREHLRRVQEAGLPVRVEMGVTCCHANQDKFWVTDPTGMEWEVYYLNYDVEDAGADDSSACCAR
jgi:hypothetical protein